MRAKKIMTAGLALVMSASFALTGCGSVSPDTVVATLGEQQITYGVANLFAKYQQATYDAYYLSYFGDDMWSQDFSGSGTTLEEEVKEDLLEALEEMYRLDSHAADYGIELTDEDMAAIEEAAEAFMEDNTDEALEKMGATAKENLVELLRVMTMDIKVKNAILDETDVTVTDEDAACRTFSYVTISTTGTTDEDGNTVEYTDDELAQLKEDASNLALSAGEGTTASGDASEADTFTTVMEDAGYTVSTYSYAADEDAMDEAVIAAADALSEGEVSDVIETDSALYILRLDSEYDEDASASHKEELISEQQQAHYEEVYAAYQEECEFVVDEAVWAKVKFDDLFTLATVESEESGDASADAE